MNDRITFRPGNLAGPLAAWCDANNATPSDAIRLALSQLLGIEVPKVVMGRPPLVSPVVPSASPTALRSRRNTAD